LAAGDALNRAADYIAVEFASTGLTVTEQTYSYHQDMVRNLMATTHQGDNQEYLVVGAHYDTVPGVVGADDNASGIAALLALAEILAERPPAIPVRLVAFTLEEPPFYMTRRQGRREERILGAIVLEMIGYTSAKQDYPFILRWAGYPKAGRFIGIIGNWASRRFGRTVSAGFRANRDLTTESLFVPFNGWPLPVTRLSDHASFWDHDVPAVMITDTAFLRNPNYHTPGDTIDTLDFPFMAQVVRGLYLAVGQLSDVYTGDL
jgi:Zn-dependent M28 family amino/carboxypeptidase